MRKEVPPAHCAWTFRFYNAVTFVMLVAGVVLLQLASDKTIGGCLIGFAVVFPLPVTLALVVWEMIRRGWLASRGWALLVSLLNCALAAVLIYWKLPWLVRLFALIGN